jgi:hypothetical protein
MDIFLTWAYGPEAALNSLKRQDTSGFLADATYPRSLVPSIILISSLLKNDLQDGVVHSVTNHFSIHI